MYKVRFFVHLLAFRNGDQRIVDVPGDEYQKEYRRSSKTVSGETVSGVLDLIFKYGQNDFQVRPMPSVSVGDVIDYFGSFYIVEDFGFRKMSIAEFTAYSTMSREDRWAVQYEMVKWNGTTYEKVEKVVYSDIESDDEPKYRPTDGREC